MNPACAPRTERDAARLLVVRSSLHSFADAQIRDLPELLDPGDLLVVNDAATLPASLPARGPSGTPMEIRLVRNVGDGIWSAVLFGAGDWRTPTELRDLPETVTPGASIEVGRDFTAEILDVFQLVRWLLDV